jgi:hypothetical protein
MGMGFSQLGFELEEIFTIFYGFSAVVYKRDIEAKTQEMYIYVDHWYTSIE